MNTLSRRIAQRIFGAVLLAVGFISPQATSQSKITSYVNPFVGTAAHGHTYPGPSVPFGMVQLSPDTRMEGWDACGGYHYSDSSIIGFSHTHFSGTGVPDYGDILVVPTTGPLSIDKGKPERPETGYRSRFRHETEEATPGYYSVLLDDYEIRAELTTTARVGVHRYTFPQSQASNILIDLKHGLGPDHVIESNIQIIGDREIVGYRRSAGWAKDQKIYFAAQFSKPFRSFGVAVNNRIHERRRMAAGRTIRGFVRYATSDREQVIMKVGISCVSIEGARRNLNAEMPGWDFDEVRRNAERTWESELSKIIVEGGTEDQYRTFYTALYHVLLTPNIFTDVDGRYRGMDDQIHTAKDFNMYSVFSLWDTFRAEHPLLTILDPTRSLHFVKSLLAKYDEASILPVWEFAANETWCMIGYHSVPVIVDAYVKGIRGFDAEKAFKAMQHSASLNHFGLEGYRQHGYIPAELASESVSKTLEYAYDDWCIAQFAQLLGKDEKYREFSERAQFYENLFDPSTRLMRPKENGSWIDPFHPTSVTQHYTEANAWQYSFFVPHDIRGLIELHGGRETFLEKLDSLFAGGSSLTGRDQPDITGLIGQYAHGNEPSHHVAYLYGYAGEPWRTQEIVRKIVDSLYTPRPDGLCGNDDCGQMSAWYVFSALGFYPVTPGLPFYVFGTPLFRSATINLENGKKFTVRAKRGSANDKYIQSARLNGNMYSRVYVSHEMIVNGGEIEFVLGSRPDFRWGVHRDEAPPSIVLQPIVTVPHIVRPSGLFSDSVKVELQCSTDGAEIHYSIQYPQVVTPFVLYEKPIILKESATLRAYAKKEPLTPSRAISATFTKFRPVGSIVLNSRYSPQYTGGGDLALIDGRRGSSDFRLGTWQGFEGSDLEAIVDLGTVKPITSVSLGCLQDIDSWIFFPTLVEVSFSDDGKTFRQAVRLSNEVSPKDETVMTKDFAYRPDKVHARFVRVRAKNMGVCPDWHKGAGSKAWLFVDEITVTTR